MHWLCIEVHLLSGRYHGRSDDGRAAEWPPNPHRLFQALIAAANLGFRRTEMSAAKEAAFRWLESRDPPEIVAPRAQEASVVRLYVPNNDMDSVVASDWKRSPAALRTGKDLRPHMLEGDATVRFLWSIPEDEWNLAQSHADILCKEAHHLHSLGLGLDLVAGNGRILNDVEKHHLPGDVYLAAATVAGDWRAPAPGSFDELVARHAGLANRVQAARGRGAVRWVAPPAPPTIYRDVAYLSQSTPQQRPVYGFAIVNEDGGYRSFDPRDTMEVAAWLRHAAHNIARNPKLKLGNSFIENFVCGHGEDAATKNDRFSYLPLPTISAKGRDGRIRRALIAEPAGGGGGEALAVARRLGGAPLIAEETGEIMAELRGVENVRNDGVMRRYLQSSRCWGTATPVVMPGRDDRRSRKAVGLVLKALAQGGWTTPVVEIQLQAEPVFPGGEMATRYRVPAYLKAYPRTHVIITFAEKIAGPVTIGGGRHVGLGVFAGLDFER